MTFLMCRPSCNELDSWYIIPVHRSTDCNYFYVEGRDMANEILFSDTFNLYSLPKVVVYPYL